MTDTDKLAWIAERCKLNEEQVAALKREVQDIARAQGISISEAIDVLVISVATRIITEQQKQIDALLAVLE